MMQKTRALIANNRRFIPLTATIFLFFFAYAVGAGVYQGMRDPQIFLNLFRTSHFYLISAIGMTFVILTGGIDLSVSGMVALTTVASAALLRDGMNPWLVMLLMLIMGMTMGTIMGCFITYMKVQPFIATLAGMWFARGMCFFISDDAIAINNRVYTILGQTKILIPGLSNPVTKQGPFISILVIVMMLVLATAIYIAHYTPFGRTVYAIGGNEQSARLMGLPVNRTKVLVYTLNGFCSALAGITMSIYVSSGHGLYATGFELTIIAAVVMGGTMLTGGVGYVFGTLFGVLILGVTQTLIQFNGRLSSWWTNIVVGALTLIFIGVQSQLAARKGRRVLNKKVSSQMVEGVKPTKLSLAPVAGIFRNIPFLQSRTRQIFAISGAAVLVIILAIFVISQSQTNIVKKATLTPINEVAGTCQLKPYRQDRVASFLKDGAVVTYERNGGALCIDEIYAIFPDGQIIGDNGESQIKNNINPENVENLLSAIANRGWYSNEMYDTWHTPCGQCYGYYITVSYNSLEKTVKAVDGGTDAPANYWQVVSMINGVIPKFDSSP